MVDLKGITGKKSLPYVFKKMQYGWISTFLDIN
jgi:hypothetical protein